MDEDGEIQHAPQQGKAIEIQKTVRAGVRPDWIRSVLAAAAAEPEVRRRLPSGWSLTLRISGDRALRRLNRDFLQEDHATDVLSFPSGESPYLGDVVVSWPAVLRQASEFGHPASAELALLSVHGLLHLLGWDHAEPVDEAEMNRLTLAGLRRSGVGLAADRLFTH